MSSSLKKDDIKHPHLAMSVNHRAQEFPGASPSVHANHAQDLQEAHAAQGWRGEDVALRPSCYHSQRCYEYDEVCEEETWDKTITVRWGWFFFFLMLTDDTDLNGTQTLTYDTEGLPGKSQPSLPSPVSAATASCPDPDEVLQPKDHDHHKLLQIRDNLRSSRLNLKENIWMNWLFVSILSVFNRREVHKTTTADWHALGSI